MIATVDEEAVPQVGSELGPWGPSRSPEWLLGVAFGWFRFGTLVVTHHHLDWPVAIAALIAAVSTVMWWRGPRPRLLGSTGDLLFVQQQVGIREVDRAQIAGVALGPGGFYGAEKLILSLRDGTSVAMGGTALRRYDLFGQRELLRAWAGLPEEAER